jgi:hypothetical protein
MPNTVYNRRLNTDSFSEFSIISVIRWYVPVLFRRIPAGQGVSEKYVPARKRIFGNLSGRSFSGNITQYYPQKHLCPESKICYFRPRQYFSDTPQYPLPTQQGYLYRSPDSSYLLQPVRNRISPRRTGPCRSFRTCSGFSHRVKNGSFFAIFHLFSVT